MDFRLELTTRRVHRDSSQSDCRRRRLSFATRVGNISKDMAWNDRDLVVQPKNSCLAIARFQSDTPLFQGMKSFCASNSALVRISPLPTLRAKLRMASPVSSMVASPAMMAPVSISMMSGMRSANEEFEDILITGAIGLPVGVPKPVVNRTKFAPAATWAVTHSTSFPGVHNKFNPGSVAYSG